MIDALLEWITQALAHEADPSNQPEPDPELLLTGLRQGDAERWDIGVGHAWSDPAKRGIWLEGMPKPKDKRTEGERPNSGRLLDPEGVFVILWHLLFHEGRRTSTNGKLWLRDSKSEGTAAGTKRLPYHYLALYKVRVPRLLSDVPDDAQSRAANPKDFRDLRRCNLLRQGLNKSEAARRFKHKVIERPFATRKGVAAIARQQHAAAGGEDVVPAEEYIRLLWAGYDLLDKLPLGEPTPRRSRAKRRK